MNWLLDTDVASQASKPRPDAKVMAWLEAHADVLFLSALTLAEMNASHFRPTGVPCAEF